MKKIAITMGEPGGIGPEVSIRAAADPGVRSACAPLIIGDRAPLEEALKLLELPFRLREIKDPLAIKDVPEAKKIDFMDMRALRGKLTKGSPGADGGMASCEYIKKASELASAREVDAICTAPISKEALKAAGIEFPGHTEMLASFTGVSEYAMMLTGGPLRVLLVTTHTAIKNVPGLIRKKLVLKKIQLAMKAARMLGIKEPRIMVSGLNPHAGEGGLFGDEEIGEIAPAVREAQRLGINATGPYPPDALFRKAYMGEADIVVAMYHDQGLIPLKMIAFDKGVNITVGLPIIRTSPDHGTAYDIAWKGIANPASMIEAVFTALRLKLQP
ncbi:MAG: 4-hydroxythreonine-4-phosphate dehydrogenase PdxA [Nitrospiraceae bacterium]|nr:4-hydroxythreonine-4-phosphate dehydrogenase PdxA [Nitrospiraceae bacterium]